ncbi:glycosyltransferase family 1 protein [Brevibacillus fluminis]|uniref:Glycosyltransferase family 1 protein n=1 Tax=Brevibacillus fluminis TaxID=511487 RepID=A0A3M8DND3_9BACL|nr:glycosyltransferase family 4 protein [Brevibacillus fluminis]RNB89593.1 glycosyltransferase family 1 protein [Brevibacillus fluminis]
MRILVIAPEQLPIPPIKGGSVETVIYEIFRRVSRKHSVVLVSRSHPRLPSVSKQNGGRLKIVRVSAPNRYSYIKKALQNVKGQKFNVIQVENRPTFVPHVRRVFKGTPIMLSLHSLTFMSHLSQKRAQAILKQTNGVTSVSKFLKHAMKRRFRKHAKKFRTAQLGVNTDRFRPRSPQFKQQLRNQWGVSGTYNVLFVGRMVHGKGLHTLVKAVALLKKHSPKVRLIAIGSSWPGVRAQSPYMKRVRQLSNSLGVPIRFTGYIPPARVAKLYHLGDVLVCPSIYREGFAMVNTEAMASGIPVVASRRGGITKIITHGKSGFLVSAYTSPKAFASRLIQLKGSPTLAKKLAAGGRRRVVQSFSWSKTVKRLLKHYRKIR